MKRSLRVPLFIILPVLLLVGCADSEHFCECKPCILSGVRGGADDFAEAEAEIQRYLDSSAEKGDFHIQGWRWHTMSLAREASRLGRLAERLQNTVTTKDLECLRDATDYVVGFNMKGLHKIERDLFFPWVRKKLASWGHDDTRFAAAFGYLIDQLDQDRKTIETLGKALDRIVKSACEATDDDARRIAAVAEVKEKSEAVAECANSMLAVEDKLLVPTIAKLVPASEQKSFNDKVIRNLGILDSRLHLVGMREAVWEKDESERQLFKASIPKIPQMLIPRWKRLLYEPRVSVLNRT